MMKKTIFILTGLALLTELSFGQYSIRAWTVSSGGTSSGGIYSVSAAVGPSNTRPINGGDYSVKASTWSLYGIVPVIGAPALRIVRADENTALILWPSSSTGWKLQERPIIGSSANWSDVTDQPILLKDENTVRVPVLAGAHYFRLQKP
jgi:hypothetical protein